MPTSSTLPKVAVIGTGGTISSVGRDSLDIATYPATGKKYEVDELLAKLPETDQVGDIIPIRFRAVGSTAIGPAEWLELNETVHRVAKDSPVLAGIVITHGTATLEETAYFLDLTVKLDIPVVLVGAQRPASGLSTDAGLNLVNAIRVAGSRTARGLGVLVLLNDEIHTARDVTKTSTLRLQTFQSPDFGLLGHADADRITIYRRPTRRHAPDTEFDVRGMDALPRVDIVLSYAGSDGAAVGAFMDAGAEGIVSAALLPGFNTPKERDALEAAAAKGVILVQSSRGLSGRLVEVKSYRPDGVVLADNLRPQKARVLLMLALTKTRDPATIQQMFDAY